MGKEESVSLALVEREKWSLMAHNLSTFAKKKGEETRSSFNANLKKISADDENLSRGINHIPYHGTIVCSEQYHCNHSLLG